MSEFELGMERNRQVTKSLLGTARIEPGEYPSNTARRVMEELVPEWQHLFLEKNKGYGEMSNELGPAAQFVDIHRKVGKLKRALWDQDDIGEFEGVREITLDLIGHCFLLLHTMQDTRTVDDGAEEGCSSAGADIRRGRSGDRKEPSDVG